MLSTCLDRFPCVRALALTGLLFFASQASYSQTTETQSVSSGIEHTIEGFVIRGNTLVSTEDLQSLLTTLHAAPLNKGSLTSARQIVIDAYKAAGYELVAIAELVQLPAAGIFLIAINEVQVAEIRVTGNEHFDETAIMQALPELKLGNTPNLNKLSSQLLLASDNPAREVTTDFRKNVAGDMLADVRVEDSATRLINLRLDNTGNDFTGDTRFVILGQHANLWNKGHLLAISSAVSPQEIDSVKQLGMFYQAPLPSLGDRIDFTAAYSDVDAGRVANVFDISGQGTHLGLHYVHYLRRTIFDEHSVDIGIERRRFEDNIGISGTTINFDVVSRPLSLGYRYSGQHNRSTYDAAVSWSKNISGGKNNDDRSYALNRSGADADWDAIRFALAYNYLSADSWGVNLRANGQYGNEALISGEQFGVGGVYSVRGLEEREVFGDSGIFISSQLSIPVFEKDHQLWVFTDIGEIWRAESLPGEIRKDFTASIGTGWRWVYEQRFSAELQFAHVLNGSTSTDNGDNKLHFSVTYQFAIP